MNREEYVKNMEGLAKRAFEDHVIRKRPPEGTQGGSYFIARGGSSMYAAEISPLYYGRFIVHGDIPIVVFENTGIQNTVWDLCQFVAVAEHYYLLEKVKLGVTKGYRDTQIAEHDMKALVSNDDFTKEYVSPEDKQELIFSARGGYWADMRQELIELNVDGEVIAGIGVTLDPAFFYARAAVLRLHELLKEEKSCD